MFIHPRHSRRGFTIIEVMVTVGIIALLLALLVPFIGRVRNNASTAASMARIQGIQNALETYYTDFKTYPPSHIPTGGHYGQINSGQGLYMLSQGLVGWLPQPDDGAGPLKIADLPQPGGDPLYGFRMRTGQMGGKVYGPYLDVDRLGYVRDAPRDPQTGTYLSSGDGRLYSGYFVDSKGYDIYYFRSNGPPTGAQPLLFAQSDTQSGFFWGGDNQAAHDPAHPELGASVNTPLGAASNAFMKLIYPNVDPLVNNQNQYKGGFVLGGDSYLLISPGPDEKYYTKDDIVVAKP